MQHKPINVYYMQHKVYISMNGNMLAKPYEDVDSFRDQKKPTQKSCLVPMKLIEY